MANAISTWLSGLRETIVARILPRELSPDQEDQHGRSFARDEFGFYPARRARYALLSALCQNTAYNEKVHPWARSIKDEFGLYPTIKPVYNPFYRLVEFWATHTYCGSIDDEMGDGVRRPSAIPILTRNEALRPALARIAKDSRLQEMITLYARTGAMLGDVGLYAVDDLESGRAYVEVIDPNTIVQYHADCLGIPYYYALEEWRPDPRPTAIVDQYGDRQRVIWREEGELQYDGAGRPVSCRFRTYLKDGGIIPYAWEGEGGRTDWSEPYPFVPLVLAPHVRIKPKVPFGQAAGAPLIVKAFGNDDIASRFHAAIGKAVDPVWLFKGVRPPGKDDMPEGGDDKWPALYGGAEAGAQALLAALNLADVDGHLDRLIREFEKDCPEIRQDIELAVGDASGVAIRTTQQRITTKAQTIRSGYDAALVSAMTYCLRIGGIRGYDGMEAFGPDADPESFRFAISGDRDVFRQAKIDTLKIDESFWANAESADRAGVPIDAYLELQGWAEDRIAIVTKARDAALAKGLSVGRQKITVTMGARPKQASPPNGPAAKAIQAPGGAAP